MDLMSQENKTFFERMLNIKKRYEDQCNLIKSLDEELRVTNLELSHMKNEYSKLIPEILEKQTSISKYQMVLQERVDVEDKCCNLLVEKKVIEKQLAEEKRLRVEQQRRNDAAYDQLFNSLQEELRILKAFKATYEESMNTKFSAEEYRENNTFDGTLLDNTNQKTTRVFTKSTKNELIVSTTPEYVKPYISDEITSTQQPTTLEKPGSSRNQKIVSSEMQISQKATAHEKFQRQSSPSVAQKDNVQNAINTSVTAGVSSTLSSPSTSNKGLLTIPLKELDNVSQHGLNVRRVICNRVKFPVIRKRKLYSRSDDNF